MSHRPSSFNSLAQSYFSDFKMLGPLRDCQTEAVGIVSNVCAAVAALFLLCGPTAFPKLVISIVVNAFNTMIVGGAGSHIGIKFQKREPPLFTNTNTSTAISRI